MRFRPTEENFSCAECQAIACELNEAFAEAYEQTSDAADALYGLIGGTEQDAERADELIGAYKISADSRLPARVRPVMAAIWRSYEHAARTGHRMKRFID